MKQDDLEQLILDCALGALSPQVEQLLDAYLVFDAESALQLQQMKHTVSLASKAMERGDAKQSLPPFPVKALLKTHRQRRSLWRVTQAAAIAACLVLAFMSGRRVQPQTDHTVSTMSIVAAPNISWPKPVVEQEDKADGFWSLAKWQQLAKDRPRRRPRWVWESFDSPPVLETQGGQL